MDVVNSPVKGRLVSHKEAAEYLTKPESWLYHEGERQGIPRYKIGNQWRYRLTELDEWIDQQVAC